MSRICLYLVCLLTALSVGVAAATPAAALTLNVGSQVTTYSSTAIRGYWFTSPSTITITGLRVATDNPGDQNIHVMRFNPGSPPPAYSASTTAYTTLFTTANTPGTSFIPVSILVNAGDMIGVLGARGTMGSTLTNSYGPQAFSSSIDGTAVTLNRLLFQGSTIPVGAVSTEASYIARVEMTYELGTGGPTAVAGGPYSGAEGAAITVNGGASTGAPTLYEWDCAGDGTYEYSGAAATFGCVYPDNGTYFAGLRVTGNGQTQTDTATVTVTNVAPTASIGGSTGGAEGSSLSFTGTATDPGSADTHTYAWTFGDGTSSTAQNASHTYADDGTFSITLTVTDDDGASATATSSVTVTNVAPTAGHGGPYTGSEGSPVLFSGSETDPGTADSHTYAWTFGDGTTGTGQNPSHTYLDDGVFTVSVTVTDDDGGASPAATTTATISNEAPTANAGGAYSGVEGAIISFNGSATDPGAGDTFTYAWTLGDGTVSTAQNPSHGYADNGTYVVTLIVTDDNGGVSPASTTSAVITNANPVAGHGGPYSGSEGAPVAFTGSVTDGGSADTHTYAWTFGDGASATGQTPSHTYAQDGSYTVTVVVTDDDGGVSATASTTATISNVAPTANANGPYTDTEGAQVQLTGTVVDPGNDTFTYAWSFGDGNTSTSQNPLHIYADNGSYSVSLTVTDSGGATSTTATTTASITNVAPTATITSVGPIDEGVSFTAGATVLDPGSADTFTYAWAFGDGATATAAAPSHAYADNGSYAVTLVVTDDDGGVSSTATTTIVVNNVAPAANPNGPYAGTEGVAVPFTAGVTDPGTADTHTVLWAFGDGATSTQLTPTHTYADNGTYTVTLTATDDDGGVSPTVATTAVIGNAAPIASVGGPYTGNEGSPVSFAGSVTDTGTADTHTWLWTFGDGNSDTLQNPTHSYADDGSYTVTLVVTDDDGAASAPVTTTSTIANVAPTVATLSGPTAGNEGSGLTYSAAGTDPGSVDQAGLSWGWTWGDGGSSTGNPETHAYDDEGTYTVTVTTTDPQGATDSDSLTVVIANVAPTFASSAPGFASENVLWTYTPTVIEPGLDTLTFSLSPSAPAAMTIDSTTGELNWTPGFNDMGVAAVTLTVDDGDGGTDSQTFTITVGFEDLDGDGMADSWETANGLDPTDPTDGAGDPDLDGVSNLDEFLGGTDPNGFDGPTAPVLDSPIAGEEVDSLRPLFTIGNAIDPQNDTLTYEYEVYEDAALTLLTTLATAQPESTGGWSTWTPDIQFVENSTLYWRARADDGNAFGPWSGTDTFFVNSLNEAPEAPVALFPVDGETIGTLLPTPQWADAVDVDNDLVTYHVRVWDQAGETLITEGTMDPNAAREAEWDINVQLEEDSWYSWEVQAIDEHGLDGAWSELELFFVTSDDAAPGAVVFISPEDGSSIPETSPDLVASETVDPEGGELVYIFGIDSVDTFDSADLVEATMAHTDSGEVTWSLSEDGVELTTDILWHARVRAEDEAGIGSGWAFTTFFVRGDNDPPEVPELLEPLDGITINEAIAAFVVGHVSDPEGDTVFYDISLAADAEMTDILDGVEGLSHGVGPLGDGTKTSWQPTANLPTSLYWSARAVDEFGAASDWAEPFQLTVDVSDPARPDPVNEACACQSSLVSQPSSAGLLALLGLVGFVRRRR